MMQLTSIIAEQTPGFMGWKDLNLVYLGCNFNLATQLELGHPSNIVGLTDRDLIDYSKKTYAFHRHNDLLALSGKTVQCIHQSTSLYGGKEFIILKKPLFNNENKIIGLIYHCTPFPVPVDPMQSMRHLYKLSAREIDCLSCVLKGKTLKETAVILKLSKRTVESYFENIKNKFGCKNKTELLIQAFKSGYIPKS